MLRWIVEGRRFFSTQAQKPNGGPFGLTREDGPRRLIETTDFRMPKHGFVVKSLLKVKKPANMTQMVRSTLFFNSGLSMPLSHPETAVLTL
jgi:hypothetical protein